MVSPTIGQYLRLDAVLDRHAGIIRRTSGKGQAGVRVHSRTRLPAYVCKAEERREKLVQSPISGS